MNKTRTRRAAPATKSVVAGASFPIVGIGASAGGLEAFSALLARLPIDTGMAFVLVQHLDPQHDSALTKLLGRTTAMPVVEVTDQLAVAPNHVYVIPPNTNLGIEGGTLTLAPRPNTRAPHRSVDFFLEALAADQHELAIGVILSGTATDGTLGLEAIKAEGGITFAQDDSARYDSMPRSAVAAGCVDAVLSPEQIADELARIAKHPHVTSVGDGPLTRGEADRAEATAHGDDDAPLPSGGQGDPDSALLQVRAEARVEGADSADRRGQDEGFKKIVGLLRNHAGVDFSLYRSSTIQRRIIRRLILTKHDTIERYAQFLRGNAHELDALYSDVLISVTSFFRNPDTFEVLQRQVLPALFKQRGDDPLRVWVLGCSTGQEAYSMAMAFVEAADHAPRMRKLQVFATDLNEALLDKARHGLYAKSVAEDLSPERLRRFFVEEGGGYRVNKGLREMVVFARQNVISDPPFSRLDLISCRNLLIYFESELQRRVFPAFHYALKPGGFLCLGASESIGSFTELFDTVDKKHKIYVRRAATVTFPLPRGKSPSDLAAGAAVGPAALHRMRVLQDDSADPARHELTAQREADRVSATHFSPPAVLINADLQILQFRGPTGAYLQPPTGKATLDVLKMARDGVMLPLRAAIAQAKKLNQTVRKDHVRLEHDGTTRTISLQVIPLKNLRDQSFLIVFDDGKTAALPALAATQPIRPRTPPGAGADRSDQSQRIAELEADVAETRDYLQALQEQYEAANEELQSSNEEVQSANEELQSINEELETSKEELESANEELTTVNEEMTTRNDELNRLNSDLINVQSSAHVAMIMLDRNLAIRRFSAQAEKQFRLAASDVGRPISATRLGLDLPELGTIITEVIDAVKADEREVRDTDGCWWSLRVRPYLTSDNKVDGAVLVLVDIDALKRSQQTVLAARDYANSIVATVREPLLVLDAELRVELANHTFYDTFGVTAADTVGRFVYDLGNRQWDIPELRRLLSMVLPQQKSVEHFQVEHSFDRLGHRVMLLNARRVHDPEHGAELILLAIEDITERTQSETERERAAAAMREADRNKNEFLAMLAHELRNPLAPILVSIEIMRRANQMEAADQERLDLSPRVDHALEVLQRQVGQMVRLVEDLLDAGRISRGKIDLRRERVELSSVVHHVVDAVLPYTDRRGQDLTVAIPPDPIYLHADPTRLAQIVGNLLNNASKFTERGGHLWLTVERSDEMSPSSGAIVPGIVIRVRDSGVGIAADRLEGIFDMFTQIDVALERSAAGLGIGLTLARTLAGMHGGTVEATSQGIGHGSEFIVRLPIVIDAAPAAPSQTSIESAATPLTILVVDDNRDSAEMLAMLLQLGGHETHTAHDGLAAVDAIHRLEPDVVVLDIGLPGLSGYEVARRVRDESGSSRRPFLVALTGWGQEEDRRRSKDAGFDAHLVKPVDEAALTKLLAELPTPESASPIRLVIDQPDQ